MNYIDKRADLEIPENVGTVKLDWNNVALSILLRVAEEHYPPGGASLRHAIKKASKKKNRRPRD